MEKIGIITFHKVDNYGAVLQAMALQEAINQFGKYGCIVDYVPKFMSDANKLIRVDSLKGCVHSVLNFPKKLKKRVVFNRFRYYRFNIVGHNLSVKDMLNLEKDIKLFAVGSDQIWNPNITKGIDPVYFGNFSGKQHNAFSYAASIGVNVLSRDQKERMVLYANSLKKISVREAEAANLLGLRNATVVCDPVLLHDDIFWRNSLDIKEKDVKYILVYALTGYKETYDMARLLADETKLPVIEIRNSFKSKRMIRGERIFSSASPEKFVELFANATYVVTDSFHGTAFSVIFEKNMFIIPNKEKGARMIELMNQMGISERIIDGPDKISVRTINSSINIEYLREQRNVMRKVSRDFLKDAILG